MKKVFAFALNIALATAFIVLFNFVFVKNNLYIGLNPISVAVSAILGVPGIAALVIGALIL